MMAHDSSFELRGYAIGFQKERYSTSKKLCNAKESPNLQMINMNLNFGRSWLDKMILCNTVPESKRGTVPCCIPRGAGSGDLRSCVPLGIQVAKLRFDCWVKYFFAMPMKVSSA